MVNSPWSMDLMLSTGSVSSPLMNYLAHLVLSPANDDILFGNYIADSIRPKEQRVWSQAMVQGYEMHMDIDRYTDQHVAFKQAKKELLDNHGKYAPVVLDILNDHLLALNWENLFYKDLSQWNQDIYKRLQPFQSLDLPPKARRLLDGLLEYRYLHVYASQEGTEDVLARMDKRARFPSNFVMGLEDLNRNSTLFQELFLNLFEDLCNRFPPTIELRTNVSINDSNRK